MIEMEAKMEQRERDERLKHNRRGDASDNRYNRHERERRKRRARQRKKFDKRQLNRNLNKALVVGIDMLGSKSDSAYHSNLDSIMYYKHLQPLMVGVTKIGSSMDEIESIQSISRNNEETYWLTLFYNAQNINFFKWIQGWVLIILSVIQIRLIRNWFNNAGYKNTDKNNKNWLFSNVKQGMSTIGIRLSSNDDKGKSNNSNIPKYRI